MSGKILAWPLWIVLSLLLSIFSPSRSQNSEWLFINLFRITAMLIFKMKLLWPKVYYPSLIKSFVFSSLDVVVWGALAIMDVVVNIGFQFSELIFSLIIDWIFRSSCRNWPFCSTNQSWWAFLIVPLVCSQ